MPQFQRQYSPWEIRVSPPIAGLPSRACCHAVLCDARYVGGGAYVVANALGPGTLSALLTLKTRVSLARERQDGTPLSGEDRASAATHVEIAIQDYLYERSGTWPLPAPPEGNADANP